MLNSADNSNAHSPATSATILQASEGADHPPSPSKAAFRQGTELRKNKSSISLKNRTLSVSSPEGSEASAGTPMSLTFSAFGSKSRQASHGGAVPSVPTPSALAFAMDGLPTGGMYLFESDYHSPDSPGSSNPLAANAPIPLEPCPESFLLRPFWLMRCFYQTLAHPRGGYLSTKLFVPRDAWCVKGVKLKALDDKIAACDLLTAALLKLAAVDTLDADAVLEEMQSFEYVLEQAQLALTKKLGADVGTHGLASVFKDAPPAPAGVVLNGTVTPVDGVSGSTISANASSDPTLSSAQHPPKGAVAQSKSVLASWRKLRAKNSGVGLAGNFTGSGKGETLSKDALLLATLPMTSLPNIRFAKRDLAQVEFVGPNANYMACLARLFDAVQVLGELSFSVCARVLFTGELD